MSPGGPSAAAGGRDPSPGSQVGAQFWRRSTLGPETSFPSLHLRHKLSHHRARSGDSETAVEEEGWWSEAGGGGLQRSTAPTSEEGKVGPSSAHRNRNVQVMGWLRPVLKQSPRQDQGSELLADLKARPWHPWGPVTPLEGLILCSPSSLSVS